MDIFALMHDAVLKSASDLHLSTGLPPMLRIHGDMHPMDTPALNADEVLQRVQALMSPAQQQVFSSQLELDFSVQLPSGERFRVNAFQQQRGPSAALRLVPSALRSLESLQAPRVLADLAMLPRGLVLFTGPTGSGKSTCWRPWWTTATSASRVTSSPSKTRSSSCTPASAAW